MIGNTYNLYSKPFFSKKIYCQVGTRMITLHMSSCLQKIDICQDKVEEITKYLYDTIQEATKWYDDFLKEQEK